MRLASKARHHRFLIAVMFTAAFCVAAVYRVGAFQRTPLVSLVTLVPLADAAHDVSMAEWTTDSAPRSLTTLLSSVRHAVSLLVQGYSGYFSTRGAQTSDVNRVVRGDGTPLIMAARACDLGGVRSLLDQGADPNLVSPGDGNPLIAAAICGRVPIASLLLERGAEVNGFVAGDETALINAAAHGHLEVVQLLVSYGADVNLAFDVETSRGRTERRSPLGQAHRYAQTAVEQYLQSVGARP